MRPPNELRKELADLLQMDQESRKNLDTISIASLIESLITYTKQLKAELETKQKKRKLA